MLINFQTIKRTDTGLLSVMKVHYSQPKGFVGRNICYAIYYDAVCYGYIIAGSATKHLPGRHNFLGTSDKDLNKIINNIFYHIEKKNGTYPIRNFTTKVLAEFKVQAAKDWLNKYGDTVVGFESLVELPRTGELYIRDGWTVVGQTKGYTCKRVSGKGSDGWSGKRVWNTKNLRPKLVLCSRL